MAFDIEKIRKDFPSLCQQRNKNPVHYLDSACMSLRPQQVINKIDEYYKEYPACAGRSYHSWGNRVTEAVDIARESIKEFIGAKKNEEIIFTKNATEAINLVASGFPFAKGDVVLTLDKEHNSNLLPWQRLAEKGVVHDIVKTNDDNSFSMENFKQALAKYKGKVKLIAFGLSANLDGVCIPAKDIAKIAHDTKITVFFDGAQYVPHHPIDVKKLDCDFLAFSGHKMCGPSGIGVLYGKKELLMKLQPLNIGGETVIDSTYDSFVPEDLPHKLEGGLQHYSGIIGLGEACTYLKKIGMDAIEKQDTALNTRLTNALLNEIRQHQVELIGPLDPKQRGGIFNFIIPGMDAHDIAIMLDESRNLMVRSGAHCVHSWYNAKMKKTSVRASFYFYNNDEDVDTLVEGIKEIIKIKKN